MIHERASVLLYTHIVCLLDIYIYITFLKFLLVRQYTSIKYVIKLPVSALTLRPSSGFYKVKNKVKIFPFTYYVNAFHTPWGIDS